MCFVNFGHLALLTNRSVYNLLAITCIHIYILLEILPVVKKFTIVETRQRVIKLVFIGDNSAFHIALALELYDLASMGK